MSSDVPQPPYELILDGLRKGDVIPFLGSGASLPAGLLDRDWDQEARYPRAAELATFLAKRVNYPEPQQDLASVAQWYVVVGGRPRLRNELHDIFARDHSTTSLHSFLAELERPLLIITTNWDDLLERAFRAHGRPFDLIVYTNDSKRGEQPLWWPHDRLEPEFKQSNKLTVDLDSRTVIYKMHGAVDRRAVERDQYVITEDDYIEFMTRMTRQKAVPVGIATALQQRSFLFLGYGLRDWNFRVLLNGIYDRRDKLLARYHDVPTSWAIQERVSPLEQRFWQNRGVEVFELSIADFVANLSNVVS